MRSLILILALFLAGLQVSCAGPATQQAPAAEGDAAPNPVAEHMGFVLGNWAIRSYANGYEPQGPTGLAMYRSRFGGMVLEETRAYDVAWARRYSASGENEIRWYGWGGDGWRYISVLPFGRVNFGVASFTEQGFRVLTGPIDIGQNIRRPMQVGAFLLTRAKEDGPFEVFDVDDPDRPLIWWSIVRMGFGTEPPMEFVPVEFLERTEQTSLERRPSAVQRERPAEWSQFDFWLGEWDLQWPGGAGTNTIESVNSGWAIRENFAAADGTGFTGGSLSVWDPGKRVWNQFWMDSTGAYLSFVGGWEGDQMILTLSNAEDMKNPGRLSRMRWHDISDDALVWTYEGSDDQGATWSTLWEINYTRRQ